MLDLYRYIDIPKFALPASSKLTVESLRSSASVAHIHRGYYTVVRT